MRFATLAELSTESPIPMIEGKIIKLFPGKSGTGQGGKAWALRNGTISDGKLRHDITFWDEEIINQIEDGKSYRIICGLNKNDKPSGVKMVEKEYKGKAQRSINVSWPATIEPLDGSTAPQSTEQPRTQATSQPRQSMNGNDNDDDSINHDPVDTRIADYFKVFDAVCEAAGHDPATEKEALNHSDLKEITTGICMSYKGKYGVHCPPIFGGELGKSQPAQASQRAGATPTTSGEEEEVPESWKDAIHKEIKLADYEEDRLAELIQWALDTPEPKGAAGKVLRPFLMEANEEKKKIASKAVSKKLAAAGMGSSFDEAEVDEVCNTEFSADYADLQYPSLFDLGNNLEEYVGKMKAAWTAKQPKTTGPKKVARKPVAATVEDDEDSMPV